MISETKRQKFFEWLTRMLDEGVRRAQQNALKNTKVWDYTNVPHREIYHVSPDGTVKFD